MLNEYRAVSAHPKKERVGYNTALAILSLTFDFLYGTQDIKKAKQRVETIN